MRSYAITCGLHRAAMKSENVITARRIDRDAMLGSGTRSARRIIHFFSSLGRFFHFFSSVQLKFGPRA